MVYDTTGEADLRASNVSAVVKGFALQEYKLKQLCMIQKSNAWTETYYKETAADLTAGGEINVKGVPRLANFPLRRGLMGAYIRKECQACNGRRNLLGRRKDQCC